MRIYKANLLLRINYRSTTKDLQAKVTRGRGSLRNHYPVVNSKRPFPIDPYH